MVKYVVKKAYFGKMPKVIEKPSVMEIMEEVKALAKHPLGTIENTGNTIDFRFNYKAKNRSFMLLERQEAKREPTDLERLNEIRAKQGLEPLERWLASKDSLRRAIEAELRIKPKIAQAAEIAKIIGKKPRIKKLKPGVARGAYKSREQSRDSTGLVPRKTPSIIPSIAISKTKPEAKKPTRKGRPAKGTVTAADVLIELGIDPRKGRGLLRKHGISREDPVAIRKFFEERNK